MKACIANIRESNHTGEFFTNALDAFDWLESRDFVGTLSTPNMSYDEALKLCRWLNGSRCVNESTSLEPRSGGVVISYR